MSLLLINSHAGVIPLPDNSVHCAITSPPYWGLRLYDTPPLVWGGDADCWHEFGEAAVRHVRGKVGDNSTLDGGPQAGGDGPLQEARQGQFCQRCGAWLGCLGLEPTPELYVEHLVEVFHEVRRVLREDGTLWLNLGDSYAGSNKGVMANGSQVAGQKQSTNAGSISGLGKTGTPSNLKPKDMVGIPWRVAFALQADGWWLRSDIIWHKPNCMPESVTDRPTKAHEYLFLLAKSQRYYYDAEAIKEPFADGTAERVNQPSLAQEGGFKSEMYQENFPGRKMRDRRPADILRAIRDSGNQGRNKRTVWTIPTAPYRGAHFATFPPALVEPCIKAGTSERGCCSVCGAPWQRIVSRGFTDHDGETASRYPSGSNTRRLALLRQASRQRGQEYTGGRSTTGWKQSCTCADAGDPVPAIVLDPFVGSGSTLLTARRLGRHGIGLDLSLPYLQEQARSRLDLDILADWGQAKAGDGEPLHDLPLFSVET